MNQITKGQHYVWCHYLKNWQVDNKVCRKSKVNGKTFSTNPKNVLKEGYFYELPFLTLQELIELWKFLEVYSLPEALELNSVFYKLIFDLSRLGDYKDEEEVNIIAKHGLETFFTNIEDYGKGIICCKIDDDIRKFIAENEDKAITFILFQYFRTRKMRDSHRAVLNLSGSIKTAIDIMLPVIFANNLTLKLSHKCNFTILTNKSKDDFFTSDQPVMNIKGEILDEDGNVKQLELLYPIGPRIALLISFEEREQKVISEDIDDSQIHFYNDCIVNNAHQYVITSNEKLFDRYINFFRNGT